MATVSDERDPRRVRLFNSQLETGVRAVFILNAAYPGSLDLSRLTWLDHLVVHTGDIGGPSSMHPDVPERTGELLVRRRLIEASLTLMRRLHLVDVVLDGGGIAYRASDEAPAFIELMRTVYAKALKERAQWLVTHVRDLDATAMAKLVSDKIDLWAIEFQGETGPTGAGT